jgi:hypothetical protein
MSAIVRRAKRKPSILEAVSSRLEVGRFGRMQANYSFFFSRPSFSLMNALISSAISSSLSHCSW